MTRRSRAAVIAAAVLVASTGCAATDAAPPEASVTEGGTAYPLTVDNCGERVVFDAAPERIVLLETAPVTILDGLGVLDRVVARAGTFAPEYYDDALTSRIDAIPALSEDLDAAGHLTMSTEIVIAQDADLALGLPEGMTREGLRDAGTNTLIQPVYCPDDVGDASFDTLYDQVRSYGRIFDRTEQAEALVADLSARVAEVEASTAGAADRTAAVLYPSVGGGPLYAYGRASMAQPQLEAAGFENVFADTADRVFEVNIEELIARDPDVLILLYQGEDSGVLETVADLPGSEALRAVREEQVLVQLFNFTEPPSPLAVTGLEQIVARFGTAG